MKSKRTIIIAEIGVNHNGSINLAKEMISAASEAGVDYVKFQTFNANQLTTKVAPKATYQISNCSKIMGDFGNTQLEMLACLELSRSNHVELMDYSKKLGVGFMSTAFDDASLSLLVDLGIEIFKVPSGEINNLSFIEKIGLSAKSVIISTGMATMGEIEAALNVLLSTGLKRQNITILHCTTDYPTAMADVNLLAMQTIKNAFQVSVGYSDHTLGIEVPIAAVALGAEVIEKHFTTDRGLPGPDHGASIEPKEMRDMVIAIRNIDLALGSPIKRPTQRELENRKFARKSIVAIKNIAKGDCFTPENIGIKRPGTGLSPTMWVEILGKYAHKDFQADDLIEF